MRNGIYRSWFKGPTIQGASAIILVDGQAISCDPTHTFFGRFTADNGRFHADVLGKRHTSLPQMASMSERDEFHIVCDGGATEETARIRCTIVEEPGQVVDIEMVWIGEI